MEEIIKEIRPSIVNSTFRSDQEIGQSSIYGMDTWKIACILYISLTTNIFGDGSADTLNGIPHLSKSGNVLRSSYNKGRHIFTKTKNLPFGASESSSNNEKSTFSKPRNLQFGVPNTDSKSYYSPTMDPQQPTMDESSGKLTVIQPYYYKPRYLEGRTLNDSREFLSPDKVLFGMPDIGNFAWTKCPHWESNSSNKWETRGRDHKIIHILAMHTQQLDGCAQIPYSFFKDIYELFKNKSFDIYGESMYWRTDGMLEYLYPHAQNDLCLMLRRAEFVKRSIADAFTPAVWWTLFLSLLLMASILRYDQLLPLTKCFNTVKVDSQHPGSIKSKK